MKITTAELHRKYFKEFVEDGQPHKLNEICAYIAQRMEEDGFSHRPANSNRVQLSLRMLLRPTEGGYFKPCFGFYQKGSQVRLSTPTQDKWSAILDKATELRYEIESAFTAEIPLENPSEAEVHDYETIGKAMLESADLILDHYSAWLATMDDHQAEQTAEMHMTM